MTDMKSKLAAAELRVLSKTLTANDGTRILVEAILLPEINAAIKDWVAVVPDSKFILIGGLALSHWVKPRYTQDIDLLFLSPTDVPDQVPGFKRNRQHAFTHNRTHVEVEVLDATFLGISQDLVEYVHRLSVEDPSGVRIPTRAGLIALKLQRFTRQDQADIEALLEDDTSSTLAELLTYPLSEAHLKHLESFDVGYRLS